MSNDLRRLPAFFSDFLHILCYTIDMIGMAVCINRRIQSRLCHRTNSLKFYFSIEIGCRIDNYQTIRCFFDYCVGKTFIEPSIT